MTFYFFPSSSGQNFVNATWQKFLFYWAKTEKFTLCANLDTSTHDFEASLDFKYSLSEWYDHMMSSLKSWPWQKLIIYYCKEILSFCQVLVGKNVLGKKQLCSGKNLKFWYPTTNYYCTNNKCNQCAEKINQNCKIILSKCFGWKTIFGYNILCNIILCWIVICMIILNHNA